MSSKKNRKASLFFKETQIQDQPIGELKVRLQEVVERLNQLITRVTEKTELAVFLIDVCQDFELDMKENWEKVTVITLDDKLEALCETERGALCSQTYKKCVAKGLEVDLVTIMRGLLSPQDMQTAVSRASTRKAEMYSNQQQKADFLGSLMGKGIMLLSLSMIKYSWYMVMKQNCERLDRIAASTAKVKMLAASCKAFVAAPEPEDNNEDDDDMDYDTLNKSDDA